mgnify:FL=1
MEDISANFYESEWKVESYYAPSSIWPCFGSASARAKVMISVDHGMKVDFERKAILTIVGNAADKPTESTKAFSNSKMNQLLIHYQEELKQLPDGHAIGALFATL